jgi:hypothetical protein
MDIIDIRIWASAPNIPEDQCVEKPRLAEEAP